MDPNGKEAESSQLPKGKKLPIATSIVSREDSSWLPKHETKKEAASNFGMDCWLDPNGKEAEISSQLPKGNKLPIATGIVSSEDSSWLPKHETKKEATLNFR